MTGSKKVNRGGLVWAALLLPLLLAACGATGVRHAHPVTVEPATAVVPDLEGQALADARRTLRHAGFRLGRIEEQRDRHIHAGTVLRQYPGPHAAAAPGRPIHLVVAATRKADQVGVPNLRGRPLDEAKRALRHAGLRLGEVRRGRGGRHQAGTVLRQDPAPRARVAPGQRVDLLLARSERRYGDDDDRDDGLGRDRGGRPEGDGKPKRVKVPDLTGLKLAKAKTRLAAAKLRLGRVTRKDAADARPGTILAQSPRAGRVEAGGRVDLVVARAVASKPKPPAKSPPPAKAKLQKVPLLTGLDVGVAENRLRKAGLRLGAVTFARSGGKSGAVVAQRLDAGTRVARGTRVPVVIVEPRD